MADLKWHYEKLDDEGKVQRVYSGTIDADGKITGKHVINVKAYFDENPNANEVIIFKGCKMIQVNRGLVRNVMFNRLFRKMYEK